MQSILLGLEIGEEKVGKGSLHLINELMRYGNPPFKLNCMGHFMDVSLKAFVR